MLSAKDNNATKIEATFFYDERYITKLVQIEKLKLKSREIFQRY